MMKEHSKYDLVNIALSHVAELVREGNYSRAKKLLDEIISIADDIENIDEKFACFFQIARAYIMIGDRKKAKEIFESVLEELGGLDDIRGRFYRLVIKVEKIKYGLTSSKFETLESIREGFEKLYLETQDISIARYYIAFLILMWAPTFKQKDLEYTIKVLYDARKQLGLLSKDPQYAELLTTIAELEVDRGDFDKALLLFEEAISIYMTNPQYFKDTIESILMFIKEKAPDKYDLFVRKMKLEQFIGV